MKTVLMMYVVLHGFGVEKTQIDELETFNDCVAAMATMHIGESYHHWHHHNSGPTFACVSAKSASIDPDEGSLKGKLLKARRAPAASENK